MKLTRRELIAAAGSAAAIAAATPALAQEGESLASLARAKGIRFGSAIGGGRAGTLTGSLEDARYRDLVASQCAAVVHENELKWGATRPDAKSFDFIAADGMLEWANTKSLQARGHTLLWHHPQWFPAWVASYDFGANPKAEAERMIAEHVSTICRRYGETIHSYDVVNEAVDADTGALRETAFSKHLGAENVIDLAFRTARENAPHAQLVYNDYMSWEPDNEAHRNGVLKLLEALKKRGTPVDALGVQAHIGTANSDGSTGFGERQEAEWRPFLDDVTAMDLRLLITEFDVHDKGLPADIAARDRAVADYGRAYLDLMLSYPQLDTVMVWGLSDRYSWLQNRWPRADKLPKRPCPYDADFRPKPLREAIADSFRTAAPRTAA
jgi:endo-1,4-beta-xylanase